MSYPYQKTNYSRRQFNPAQQKDLNQAKSGKVYVSPSTYSQLKEENGQKTPIYLQLNGYIVTIDKSDQFPDNSLALNKFQRQIFRIDMVNPINYDIFQIPMDKEYRLGVLKMELECIQVSQQLQTQKFEVDDAEFIQQFQENYKEQFFRANQILAMSYNNCLFTMKIVESQNIKVGIKGMEDLPYGMLVKETDIELQCKHNTTFQLKKAGQKAKEIFIENFQFEDMGIGGLDNQLANIFRRAFASRRFPPQILLKYGIKHVKGVLLYGPPGTGKTLIARQLAKALNVVEPKIVNGPEIMSAYVGKSEENIRELFADAKRDMQNMGDDSPLHIIIFDEMDAICKQRGREAGAGGSAKDGVVNQLLSMLEGVEQLNNILVIGMTNRKDLIDEAMIRPGRFEVHIEISLPDEKGRQDILKIHTNNMRKNKVLGSDVDLAYFAAESKNFTGAEIEALVKSATSFAFNRVHDIMDLKKKNLEKEVIVEKKDFVKALGEIKPAFGLDEDKFSVYKRSELIDYGARFSRIQTLIQNSIQQTKQGKSSQLHSILLEGEVGTGKTSIAARAALKCGFPFVQMISPENFVGYSENGKINAIVKIFEDAYRSPLSCIVLDNVERLIEFIDMGPRFSNGILQALLVLIKKIPPNKESRLLVIGTSNQAKILKDLEITSCFNLTINVPKLKGLQELSPFLSQYNISQEDQLKISQQIEGVSVKQLEMILDMLQVESEESQKPITAIEFVNCYDSVNQDNQ